MQITQGSILIPGAQVKKFARALYKHIGHSQEDLKKMYDLISMIDRDLANSIETRVSNYQNNVDPVE